MTTFAQDAFTDTDNTLLENHTGETGATWTKHGLTGTGSAQITNANRLQNGTANSVIYTASGTPPSASYGVSFTFRMITDVNDVAGVAGRLASTTVGNGYIAYAFGGIQYKLSRVDAGVETVLGSVDEVYSTGTDYTGKLDITDGAKRFLVDGVQKITSADNTYTAAGLAGVLFNTVAGSDTTGTHLDNFVASDGILYTRTVTDAAIISDAPTRGVKAFRQLPQDAMALADMLLYGQTHGRVAADSAALSDSLLRAAQAYRATHDDTVINDNTLRFAQLFRELLDSVEASDLALRYVLLQRLLHDDVNANDTLASQITYYAQLLGFVLQSLRVEPVVMALEAVAAVHIDLRQEGNALATLNAHAAQLSFARAQNILMEMRNL